MPEPMNSLHGWRCSVLSMKCTWYVKFSSAFEEEETIVVKAGHWKMGSFGPGEGENEKKIVQLQSTQWLKDLNTFSLKLLNSEDSRIWLQGHLRWGSWVSEAVWCRSVFERRTPYFYDEESHGPVFHGQHLENRDLKLGCFLVKGSTETRRVEWFRGTRYQLPEEGINCRGGAECQRAFGQVINKNIKWMREKKPLACMTTVVSGMLVLDYTGGW